VDISDKAFVCEQNVASELQNALQASHPFPVSHASKNCFAGPRIVLMNGSPFGG
jgi:hypothetical protein